MPTLPDLTSRLTSEQREALESLRTPVLIQAYLDDTPYSPENANRSPLRVMQDRLAHCLDGGLFAAMALRRLGFPPLIVDLLPEPGRDDDHVLAIFKIDGCYGALAKSNYVGLRYREPVFRSLRELVMSYFEVFFNTEAEKTLRSYTRPIYLAAYDRMDWLWNDAAADAVEASLKTLKTIPLVTPRQVARLEKVDPLSQKAGLLVANPAGLYKPH
jgi:hypothetical protein